MRAKNVVLDGKTILVTGAAGFIGSNLIKDLLMTLKDATIVGFDNLCDYYDVDLKESRLSEIDELARDLRSGNNWMLVRGGIEDVQIVTRTFTIYRPHVVVNLAAQAGVRYSIQNPSAYIQSNLVGFFNILEACRNHPVEHLVYASSSSVYGSNTMIPYSTADKTDAPVSLYAATKKSNELMAHAYSKLYDIPATGLRFFTVYGPAGRPDMAYFSFTDKLIKGDRIQLFNYGDCRRDFTYVDDVVRGIHSIMEAAPDRTQGSDGLPVPPFKVYNIGNCHPENLRDFVTILSEELMAAGLLERDFDLSHHVDLVPMQPGDVVETYADITELEEDFSFRPSTPLRQGLRNFVIWYKRYHGL